MRLDRYQDPHQYALHLYHLPHHPPDDVLIVDDLIHRDHYGCWSLNKRSYFLLSRPETCKIELDDGQRGE